MPVAVQDGNKLSKEEVTRGTGNFQENTAWVMVTAVLTRRETQFIPGWEVTLRSRYAWYAALSERSRDI